MQQTTIKYDCQIIRHIIDIDAYLGPADSEAFLFRTMALDLVGWTSGREGAASNFIL
jgi:hypothetical protein